MTSPSPQCRLPFDAILFDLDGVLIDTEQFHYRLWVEFAKRRSYVPTAEQLTATNGSRAEETLRNWFGRDLPDDVVAEWIVERERDASERLAIESFTAVPGACEFVAAVKQVGCPIALVTSAVPENAHLSLDRIGLRDAFDVMITARDVPRGKPHPDCYLEAARRLGVDPANCLVVEDSLTGLRAGKDAGAKLLAMTTTFPHESLAELQPDWLARDFHDLPDGFAFEPPAIAG